MILVFDQREHRLADRVPSRLVTRNHEQQEVVVKVAPRQRLAILGDLVHESADQVGAVAAFAPSGDRDRTRTPRAPLGAERQVSVLITVGIGDQVI